MPTPLSSTTYTSTPLTNLSTAYLQADNVFVANTMFPTVNVQRQGGQYYTYNRNDWFRTVAQKRAPSTESAGGGWRVGKKNYYADVFAVHKDIDDQDRANVDVQFNLDRDATQWVTRQLLLRRDLDFLTTYMVTGVWGTDVTGVAAGPTGNQFVQFDLAASDPIETIMKYIIYMEKRTGYRPNRLAMGPSVMNVLQNHPDFMERIKYTQRGVVTEDLVGSLLARPGEPFTVVVTRANLLTTGQSASETGTEALSFMSDNKMLLAYSAPSAGLQQVSAGYTFGWSGFLGAGAFANRIKRFRMEEIESDRIEGEMAYDLQVVAPDLGILFDAVVSAAAIA